MEEINIKLDVFEGPLDLLLHLIQKLEIDVYDIPIASDHRTIYAIYSCNESLELEVAGEYLVMAATLMAIKSQMLLPKQEILIEENDPYEEDPRDMLVAHYWNTVNTNTQPNNYPKKRKNEVYTLRKIRWMSMPIKKKVMNWQPTGSTRSI